VLLEEGIGSDSSNCETSRGWIGDLKDERLSLLLLLLLLLLLWLLLLLFVIEVIGVELKIEGGPAEACPWKFIGERTIVILAPLGCA
jgi:hypothetical protein